MRAHLAAWRRRQRSAILFVPVAIPAPRITASGLKPGRVFIRMVEAHR